MCDNRTDSGSSFYFQVRFFLLDLYELVYSWFRRKSDNYVFNRQIYVFSLFEII
jgi:hypothetical protein